jgi:molybdopterin synthase catalytic subunit
MNIPILTYQKIDLAYLLSIAHHPQSGAVVLFSGEARASNLGKEVSSLFFEAFEPMAVSLIEDILQKAIKEFGLNFACCQHKLGSVAISESAVAVITTASHRKEAYEANQYIMHRLKHEVPIWKRETFTDGTVLWGNNCNCPDPLNHIPYTSSLLSLVNGNAT